MNTIDNLQLVSYLTAAKIFEKNQNIYECFLPIVESVLISAMDKNKISFYGLQSQINNTYHIDMSKSTLKRLLDILQERGEIKLNTNTITMALKNHVYSDFWNQRSERESIIGDFFIAFNSFLVNKGFDFSLQEIKTECCNWLYANSLRLASFIGNGVLLKSKSDLEEENYEFSNQLIDFLLEIKNKKHEYFNTFLLLYNGAIHASLLNFDVKQINNISDASLQFKNVILDTNFILRILNLQSELDCNIADETLSTLKKYGAHFFVLAQTIEEIQKSIKNYLSESEPFTSYTQTYFKNSKIRMTGFYEASKRGVTRTEFLNFTRKDHIKSKISELINAEFIDNFDDELISNSQIDSLVKSKNRDGYGVDQARHDLCLIEYCKSNRSQDISSLKDVDFWVLTNDDKLTFWNQCNSGDFQECLTEIQLSNLMWIQKKKDDNLGLMQTILSLSSGTALSSYGIEQFANKIRAYQESNKDNTKNLDKLSLIFASHALTTSDINKINKEDHALNELIEEKILKIRENEIIQRQEIENIKEHRDQLSEENSELESKINALELKITIQSNENKIEKYQRDIKDLECERNKHYTKLKIYQDLKQYRNDHEKSSVRLLFVMIIFPVIFMVICYFMLFYSNICLFMKTLDGLSNFSQNILCSIGIPFSFVLLYYCIMIIIFASPISPKELFDIIKDKFLKHRCQKYLKTKNVSINYAEYDVDKKIKYYKSKIVELDKAIKSIQTNIADITNHNNTLSGYQSDK